jgi:hypothetical protein
MPRTDEGELFHNGPVALPGGRGVLFQIRRGAEFDVAVVDLRTGGHTVLVAGARAPRYSRTGHLLYVAGTGTLVAAPFDEDALSLTGDGAAIVDGVYERGLGRTDVALAADGTLMYSTGVANESELVRVGRDGVATEVDPGWRGAFQSLALSPDGTRLAVSIARDRVPLGAPLSTPQDVWIKQLDRGPLSRLTFDGASNSRPAWLPDGRTVSFNSDREGPTLTLWTARADGSGTAERILKLDVPINYSTWSPDGQWVVVRAGGPGVGELIALRPGVDSVARPLLATRFDEQFPELSPGGRWLAYVSNESGRTEVYVRPFPDVEAGRWQVSTSGGTSPLWAHDGGELFYVSGSGDLVAVEVGGATTFQVGAARVLFPLEAYRFSSGSPTYAVTPDDQHFIMMRASSTEVEELIVVENFAEELKERVPR